MRKIADRRTRSGSEAREVSPATESRGISGTQDRISFIWPFLIGGAAFFLVTGGAILRPGNLNWLMQGDGAMNLLGWMFFRNAPILQQPFGANWQYGMDISSSVVYADPVTLMAIFFKPLKALLPEHFQYLGIWILICYLLQSFFAWKLLGRMTDRVWHKVFATLFFVLAPPFVWRLQFHFQLGSHWLLLASLYLYLSPRFRSISWLILLILASLITPYLFAMTILLFGATLAKHCTNGELRIMQGLKTVALTISLLLFVMWQAGYFMSSTVGDAGFGYFRASVLAFIDPSPGTDLGHGTTWSHLLEEQPKAPGQGEGFCFLGIGMILLSIVAVWEGVRLGVRPISWRKLWPLLLVFAFCFLYALSSTVAVGEMVIFHYDVPGIVKHLTDALRGSGRFLWPPYYMLLTGILALVLTRLRGRESLALISFCALLQVADSWQALTAVRHTYQTLSDYHPTLLTSPFWRRAVDRYKHILFVLPVNMAEMRPYIPLCFFAATHHIPINAGLFTRVDEKKLAATRKNLLQVIESGQFDPKALYVFQSGGLWGKAVLRMTDKDWAGVVDGFDILAPDWDGAKEQQDALTILRQVIPVYRFGGAQLLEFAGAEGRKNLGHGWSQPDAMEGQWGVWSDGESASILLVLDREPATDACLKLDGVGFVNAKCPTQHVEVSVNSVAVGELTYSQTDPGGSRSIRVPREALVGRRGLVDIQFRFKDNDSPFRLGLSTDWRSLALWLKTLRLNPVENN